MVDQGKIVDLVFFDYSKAFDSVCHSTLMVKLQQIGIQGYILEWIRGFLTGRRMRVRVNGVLMNMFLLLAEYLKALSLDLYYF